MIYATVTGRLAVDAALKDINGKNYIRSTVPQQDRRDAPTIWVDVLIPAGQNPDGMLSVLKKGAVVSANGDLKVRTYTAKDGSTKTDVSLWAGRINVEKYAEQEQQQAAQAKEDDPDADLPF